MKSDISTWRPTTVWSKPITDRDILGMAYGGNSVFRRRVDKILSRLNLRPEQMLIAKEVLLYGEALVSKEDGTILNPNKYIVWGPRNWWSKDIDITDIHLNQIYGYTYYANYICPISIRGTSFFDPDYKLRPRPGYNEQVIVDKLTFILGK